jgi:hypothetical protein
MEIRSKNNNMSLNMGQNSPDQTMMMQMMGGYNPYMDPNVLLSMQQQMMNMGGKLTNIIILI